MARQISMEAALDAYQKKCSDLLHANILLEAQNTVLDTENAELRAQNKQTQAGATPAVPGGGTMGAGYPQHTASQDTVPDRD